MIMRESLLKYINGQEEEIMKQLQDIQWVSESKLRDMDYSEVIIHTINLHTLRTQIALLEDLESKINSGLFDVPETGSCCGGDCDKE